MPLFHVVQRVRKTTYVASLLPPPNANIAPPTMYWLHVLDDGVPNVEGKALNVTRMMTRQNSVRDTS